MESDNATRCFAALAHPSRLEAFRALVRAGGAVPAGELAEALGVPPSTLSFHLKELRLAGLVGAEREGRTRLYRARFDTVAGLRDFLMEDCCGGRCG